MVWYRQGLSGHSAGATSEIKLEIKDWGYSTGAINRESAKHSNSKYVQADHCYPVLKNKI